MRSLRHLWADEAGFVVSAELVMIATVAVVGLTVGLVSLRNQVVQELTDVGQAIGSLSQSYCYSGVGKPWVAFTDGSCYLDKTDFCQDVYQVPGTEPGGISVRLWPGCAPWGAPGGELGPAPLGPPPLPPAPLPPPMSQAVPNAWLAVLQAFEGYPGALVRVEVLDRPTVCREIAPAASTAPGAEEYLLSYKLAIWVDPERYARFHAGLIQQLAAVALRKGEWIAAIEPRNGPSPAAESLLPAGSFYEGGFDVRSEQAFHAGDWGTDQADLGREMLILVNTPRNEPRTAWTWFNLPRGEGSLHRGLKVNVEFVGNDGKPIGQDVVPLNLGYNTSPPGLEVFDIFNRRDSDFRTLETLGAMNPTATTAAVAARRQLAQHQPEDLLVMVSPHLVLANGGDPPRSFATRLVVPLTKKLTAQEAQAFQAIRATVAPYPMAD